MEPTELLQNLGVVWLVLKHSLVRVPSGLVLNLSIVARD